MILDMPMLSTVVYDRKERVDVDVGTIIIVTIRVEHYPSYRDHYFTPLLGTSPEREMTIDIISLDEGTRRW